MRPDVDGEEDAEGSPISGEEDDRAEVAGLAAILNGVNADGQHSDEGVGKQILRGGQNIEDDQHLEVEDDDEDDLPDAKVREMSEQLALLHGPARQDDDDDEVEDDDDQGQDGFGEDDEPMIDTDNLDDKEKALLCRYLQAEYEKDPESMPMPREVVEEFLARNQDLLEQLDDLEEDGQGLGDDGLPSAMRHRAEAEELGAAGGESVNNGIDSNEIVVERQPDEIDVDDANKSSADEDDEQGDDDGMGGRDPTAQAEEEGEDEGEPGDEMDSAPDGQYLGHEQLKQRQQIMQVGEMNIEGSEHNLEDEDGMAVGNGYGPAGANEYIQQ
jgi:hypothetical protein